MADERQAGTSLEFTPEDEIDELFARANANPTRLGCPAREVLVALARRERPIDDPAYEHLTRCSPCYLEVRALQETDKQRRRHRILSTVAWTSAAAVVLVALATSWVFFLGKGGVRGSRATELRTELDLRPYALRRSAPQRGNLPPLVLQRAHITLTMLLPAGSEPGAYQVQMLDSRLASKASAAGDAELRNHVTTLQTSFDLASLSPGSYQLAIRRNGEDWQLFPAQVQ
jgi:hypothetical protein